MTQAPLDIDHLRQWIGRTEVAQDTVSPRLVAGYLAVLDDKQLVVDSDPRKVAKTGATQHHDPLASGQQE